MFMFLTAVRLTLHPTFQSTRPLLVLFLGHMREGKFFLPSHLAFEQG